MDSQSFKNALEDARPAIESLLNLGLTRRDALEITSSYEMGERSMKEHSALVDCTLSDLFSRYDVSRVEIGMVRFHDHPEPMLGGWVVGQVEADYLLLDAKSGEILVTDIAAPDHVIWRCAHDGESFLAALAVAAKYLAARMLADQSKTAHQAALESCVSLSGGGVYSAFYKMLIGVDGDDLPGPT